MKSEDLQISVHKIAVKYLFENANDHDVDATVAFPLPELNGATVANNPDSYLAVTWLPRCSSGSRFLVAARALIHPSNPKSGLPGGPGENRHSLTLLGMTQLRGYR
jgi:Domain of unknown function (DUF4424)